LFAAGLGLLFCHYGELPFFLKIFWLPKPQRPIWNHLKAVKISI
jgi:hypothetical protein